MKLTRRVLLAANTQLKSQLMACNPESRQGLKSKLAAARADNERMTKAVEALTAKVEALIPKKQEAVAA